MGPGGIWIIDLDGVAYDLPIRDLRKLIASTMDDMGTWDLTWMRGMIDAYHEANPIEPELYQMLLVDFSLPNEFYKNVKAVVTKTSSSPGFSPLHSTCAGLVLFRPPSPDAVLFRPRWPPTRHPHRTHRRRSVWGAGLTH